jgi:hypothetical protein
VILLGGCGSFADSTSSSPAAPRAAGTTSSSSSAADGPADTLPSPVPVPSTSPPGARTPADIAVAAMTAYVDHSVDAAGWIANLGQYLSAQARTDYAYTDPANVPAHQIVGAPQVIDASAYLTLVAVGTDAGTYRVVESRAADGHWQVERIEPPENQ